MENHTHTYLKCPPVLFPFSLFFDIFRLWAFVVRAFGFSRFRLLGVHNLILTRLGVQKKKKKKVPF